MKAVTYECLQHWHKHKFEKLGWMVLALKEMQTNEDPEVKEHMSNKINNYLQSLNALAKSIAEKITTVNDIDRKNDLMILQQNTQTLLKFAKATLVNTTQLGGKRRKSKKTSRKGSRKPSKKD